MVTRDGADIIGATVRQLERNVDEILVLDHRSADGTRDLLERLPVEWEPYDGALFQPSALTTRLARKALERGHSWVLPVDQDELWYTTTGTTIRGLLSARFITTEAVSGLVYDYVPTGLDGDDPDPTKRLCWRQRHFNTVKVASRLTPSITIQVGSNAPSYGDRAAPIPPPLEAKLMVRHYSVTSFSHLLRKIRLMRESYRGAELYGDFMSRWRGKTERQIRADYEKNFYVADPEQAGLIHDPAP